MLKDRLFLEKILEVFGSSKLEASRMFIVEIEKSSEHVRWLCEQFGGELFNHAEAASFIIAIHDRIDYCCTLFTQFIELSGLTKTSKVLSF